MLHLFQKFAKTKSAIPDKTTKFVTEDGNQSLEKFKEWAKVYHRDGSWLLSVRVLNTISVFIYQGTVFYAQQALFETLVICKEGEDNSSFCNLAEIRGT